MPTPFVNKENFRSQDRLVLVQGEQILLLGENYLWNASDVGAIPNADNAILVEDGVERLLVIDVPEHGDIPTGVEAVSLRGLLFHSEKAILTAGKANQYLHWVRSHRFCGYCGERTVTSNNELALTCTDCGHHFFPRINPCVIMLVVRGREILLARNARTRSGFYSCLAGFIEAGETAEQTVHREVREECGLEVGNLRYFKSQSWPFPSQLMLGFYADYVGGDIIPEEAEIEEADWFDVDELPQVPSAQISIAGELIENYVKLVRTGGFEQSTDHQ